MENTQKRIAVIIPCFKVKKHILSVLSKMSSVVWRIYVVDDCCPEKSGEYIEKNSIDSRVVVIYHSENMGVGGATLTGFKQAIQDGADILVKVDGDGQMDLSILSKFVSPIEKETADYTKGNRFYDLTYIRRMPGIRLFGNTILSIISKFSSGYWNIFDPTNGYLAISAKVAKLLPMDKISRRYFFETDLLFRLYLIRAVVFDIPMEAVYNNEISNLKISKEFPIFFAGHLKNFTKRIFYCYFLRDINAGSFELVLGFLLLSFGVIFGCTSWVNGMLNETIATSGTVMLAALPIILGIQFLLAFLNGDIANVPTYPIQKKT